MLQPRISTLHEWLLEGPVLPNNILAVLIVQVFAFWKRALIKRENIVAKPLLCIPKPLSPKHLALSGRPKPLTLNPTEGCAVGPGVVNIRKNTYFHDV